MNTRNKLRLVPVLAVGALVLAACGSDGGTGAAAPAESTGGTAATETAGGASEELSEITVGVLPIVDVAPIYLAADLGIFEEHGLDVTLEVGQGGAALVPAVVSGEYDFGFSNFTSQVVAASQGLPLLSVSPGVFTTGERGTDNAAVVALPETGVESPADLAGLTVATNTLGNNFVMTVSHAVEQDGGDPNSIQWVEIAWPDMPAAVQRGDVDAGVVVEPFLTFSQDIGAEPVVWNWVETDPNFLVAGYFTTEGFAEENPEVVERFVAAMDEARAYADENPDEVRRITGTYTELGEDVLERINIPRFGGEFVVDELQRQADLATSFGVASGPVDVNDMIMD